MGLICMGLLPFFIILFAFVFSLGCVYLCFHLPSTFDGWVHVLVFYIYWVFFLNSIIRLLHEVCSKTTSPLKGFLLCQLMSLSQRLHVPKLGSKCLFKFVDLCQDCKVKLNH